MFGYGTRQGSGGDRVLPSIQGFSPWPAGAITTIFTNKKHPNILSWTRQIQFWYRLRKIQHGKWFSKTLRGKRFLASIDLQNGEKVWIRRSLTTPTDHTSRGQVKIHKVSTRAWIRSAIHLHHNTYHFDMAPGGILHYLHIKYNQLGNQNRPRPHIDQGSLMTSGPFKESLKITIFIIVLLRKQPP